MKNIIIDCQEIVSRSDLHNAFADALAFPDHYGNNLDALHDYLTDISVEAQIRLIHWDAAEERLGKYAHAAKWAIGDAAAQNPALDVAFE